MVHLYLSNVWQTRNEIRSFFFRFYWKQKHNETAVPVTSSNPPIRTTRIKKKQKQKIRNISCIKKTHASTLYHYTSSVIHIYIFTNIWKIENNNGNIKIKETTIGIKHQIIMRAGTIYIFLFCFIVPIMHHSWKYRTGITAEAWSAGQIMHVCPLCVRVLFVVLLTFILVLNFCVHSCSTCQSRKPPTRRLSLWRREEFLRLEYHCQQQ